MARELYTYASGEVLLVPGTRKCLTGVMIGNDVYVRALLKRFSVGANGNVAVGKGLYWRLCAAAEGLGAAGTVINPSFRSQRAIDYANQFTSPSLAPFTTAKFGFVIPTTLVRVLRDGELHNNAGLVIDGFPRGEEPEMLGQNMCYWLDVLQPAAETACSVMSWLEVEE